MLLTAVAATTSATMAAMAGAIFDDDVSAAVTGPCPVRQIVEMKIEREHLLATRSKSRRHLHLI